MWWKWLIFAIVIIVTPFAVAYVGVCVKRKNKLTKEQEKAIDVTVIKFILFYWLADLFYMSFIIDSIPCKYIFGGLILLIIFYNLTMSFLSSTKKDALQRVGLLQDFVVGVVLTIYLIYLIPGKQIQINGVVTMDNSLRDIITTIVAALYGGLFTLVGVAWTIRKGDKDRQEEERKKNVPYITILSETLFPSEQHTDYSINIDKADRDGKFCYNVSPFTIKNISNSHIFLVGIKINDKIYYNSNKKLIEKGASLDVKLSCPLRIDCELKNVNLIIEDILGNKYFIQCIFGKRSYKEKWNSDPHNDTDSYEEQFRYVIQSVELPILQKE